MLQIFSLIVFLVQLICFDIHLVIFLFFHCPSRSHKEEAVNFRVAKTTEMSQLEKVVCLKRGNHFFNTFSHKERSSWYTWHIYQSLISSIQLWESSWGIASSVLCCIHENLPHSPCCIIQSSLMVLPFEYKVNESIVTVPSSWSPSLSFSCE